MATNRSKSAPKRETRTPVSFETAVHLCPHQGVADNVAQAFGLIVPEYEAIRAQHSIAVKRMAEAFEGSLNDKATAMHFQRIVGALVSSAVGAGRFYSEKVTQARDATARAADGGDMRAKIIAFTPRGLALLDNMAVAIAATEAETRSIIGVDFVAATKERLAVYTKSTGP